MSIRCVVLLSGGLDSMLAIRIMQRQGIEVESLNFKTIFTCCQDQAATAARDLGVRLTVVGQEDDYLDLVCRPRFGYGRGANPCVDCRIYMFRRSVEFLQQVGARFIVSGEIVGQRPMSQKRSDLDIISRHAGLEDLLLRPLSAQIFPPTKPEREGWVDREQLYGFQGRSRKGLIDLAKTFGLTNIPSPSTGCALTEPRFSQKVFDLIELDPASRRWDFELLTVGRHFRFDEYTKVIIGRREEENEALRYAHNLSDARSTAFLTPENFIGPAGLLIGLPSTAAIYFAAGLLARYCNRLDTQDARVNVLQQNETQIVRATPSEAIINAQTLASAP